MRPLIRLVVTALFSAVVLLVAVAGVQADNPPDLGWAPGAFDFGLIGVGETSTQTFTLTNNGGSASAALTVALSGDGPFAITGNDCKGSLGPGKSCTVVVEYAPTTSGPSGAVTLDASGRKAAAEASLALSGSAGLKFVASGPAVPGLSPLNENPPHPESSASGTATVFWDTTTNMMTVHAEFSGLTTGNTAAHIHCCVDPPGNVGVATTIPTFTGFPGGVTSGTYTHTFDMTAASSYNPAFVMSHGGTVESAAAALLAGLQAGQAYLNIHTPTFMGGEERGFLQPS